MKKSILFACSVLLFSLQLTSALGQKMKLESGSFSVLKGATMLNVEYSYDNMGVGKFDNEQDYITKKVAEYNKKEAGTGDKWKESWFADREKRFEPQFEELMNKGFGEKATGLALFHDPGAKYTLIVHTTFTEPGYNIGISRMNAYIDAKVELVETANRDNSLARMSIDNAPGRDVMGYDFDTGYRIQEAYAKMGKELSYFIWKMALK
jgi:hypothetical protein